MTKYRYSQRKLLESGKEFLIGCYVEEIRKD